MKQARKLARRASRTSARRFLAEGPQAVREALRTTARPACVREVFATSDAEDRYPDLRDAARAADVDWHRVHDEAIAALTETVSPQGVVAVCDFIDVPAGRRAGRRRRIWSRSAPTSATPATPAP